MVTKLIYTDTLRQAIGLDNGYQIEDTKAIRCIEVATTTIEGLLGRSLLKAARTEILDSKKNYTTGYSLYGESESGYMSYADPKAIALKHYPIDTNATFEVYYDVNGAFGVDTLVDPTKYTLDPDTGLIWFNISMIAVRRALKVVYTAGYAVTTRDGDTSLEENLPPDLVQAAITQARHNWDRNASSNINSAYSGSVGSTNSTRYINAAGITPEAMAIIAQHRRPKVAVL